MSKPFKRQDKRNGGIRFYRQLECCAVTEEMRTNSNAVGHLVGGWLPSLIVKLLVPAILQKTYDQEGRSKSVQKGL